MARGTLPFLLVLNSAFGWPVTFAAAPAAAQTRPARSSDASSEVVVIDGSKNPEMIPQWHAWEFAFRIMNELPTTVYRVVSSEERTLILAEAQAGLQRDKACQERMGKLAARVGQEKISVVNAKQREIQLDCRWDTLQARDRLLERLNPEGQSELIKFVEDKKAGTTVTIRKREIAHYLQPQ